MLEPRDRLSTGVTRARVDLEVRRGARPGAVVALCMVLGLFLASYVVRHVSKTAFRSTYQARFALSDATAIVPGLHEVRFKGVPVGTITKVQMQDRRPVITVKIRSGAGRLYHGVRSELRPNTALQDMYLDVIDRGKKAQGRLKAGDVVPATQTATPVSADDVLNLFQPTVRQRMRTLLDQLGNGMAGHGAQLRAILAEAVPLLRVAGDISAGLRQRAPRVRRLVQNAALLTRDLGRHETQLRTLLQEGSRTLGTLQAGSPDLDATLSALPPTLDRLQSAFAAVRGVLPPVDAAVTSLDPVAGRLSESLASLRRLGGVARPAVAALQRPVTHLVPLASTLTPVGAELRLGVDRLAPQVPVVDKLTTGLVSCRKGFQGFFQWNASMTKFGDARGAVPRGNVVMGLQSTSVLNDPNEYVPKACVPGPVVGGRPATAKDGQ
jgi:phospholipid/cholesterol/gamma-HCH transport system substrate-binding protein